jgi:lipopolysaccharide/colanic/teichoic acid biosynthesis glycosyltransferase
MASTSRRFHLVPESRASKSPQRSIERSAGSRLAWLDRFHPSRHWLPGRAYEFAKRALDLLLLPLTAPLWLPVLALCALAIKLESPRGPVFFMQSRTGQGGRRFRMFKFRTMVPNAEELKAEVQHLSTVAWPDFSLEDDPRQTRVGRILRKTSLDELPQLLNVLLGDMSLVGPRPTSFAPDTYSAWHTARLEVTPGVTGLWQVIGRGTTEFDERVRLDAAYIERRCLGLDLLLLFRTAFALLDRRGSRQVGPAHAN